MSLFAHVWRVDISPHASRSLRHLNALLCAAVVLLWLASALPLALKLMGVILIVVFAIRQHQVMKRSPSWRLEECADEEDHQIIRWRLHWRGVAQPVRIKRHYSWRYLVVLDVEVLAANTWDKAALNATSFKKNQRKHILSCVACKPRRRYRLVVLPDALSADNFRRLRVRLRFGLGDTDADITPKTKETTRWFY